MSTRYFLPEFVRSSGSAKLILLAAVFLLLPISPISAATFTANDHSSFVSAINSANGNNEADIINITGNITIIADPPNINTSITFNGNGHTIYGALQYRPFRVNVGGTDVVFNHMTIAESSGNFGAGIRASPNSGGNARVTLNGVTIRDNEATNQGGGLECFWTDLTVTNSIFYNNTAANNGGGISLGTSCSATFNRVAVYNNTVTGQGSNKGGGGIFAGSDSEMTMNNSTIYGNSTNALGGGLLIASNVKNFRFNHVTITKNVANSSSWGGGIYYQAGLLHLKNIILYGNTNGDCAKLGSLNTPFTVTGIIGSKGSCQASGHSGDDPQLSSEPFTEFSDGVFQPYFLPSLTGSAVDPAGGTCLSGDDLTIDQIGGSRPKSGCDYGAVEAGAASARGVKEPPGTSSQNINILSASPTTIREGGGTVTVTARFARPATEKRIIGLTVYGSASAGSDFTLSPSSITIDQGQRSGSATITIIDDDVEDSGEVIRIFPTNVPNEAFPANETIYTFTGVAITILNDEDPAPQDPPAQDPAPQDPPPQDPPPQDPPPQEPPEQEEETATDGDGEDCYVDRDGARFHCPADLCAGGLTEAEADECVAFYLGKAVAAPELSGLGAPYPTPFNAEVTIPFGLAEAGPVYLFVYNLMGQQIRVLADSWLAAGAHRVRWDGRTDVGAEVSSGVYLVVLQTGEAVQTAKLALIR